MRILNVGHILLQSRANGPGLRAPVWVQGCSIRCTGCGNRELLSHKKRYVVDPAKLLASILFHSPNIEGVSLSGGEPFEQPSSSSMFLRKAKKQGLSTVVFTGYLYENLLNSKEQSIKLMLENTDILIDGPFQQENAGDFLWRGSSNQRVLFLTERYVESILSNPQLPNEEIIFDPESMVMVQTGNVTLKLMKN